MFGVVGSLLNRNPPRPSLRSERATLLSGSSTHGRPDGRRGRHTERTYYIEPRVLPFGPKARWAVLPTRKTGSSYGGNDSR